MDKVGKDKKKIKEEVITSYPNRDSQDEKIKEMYRLIRNLTNKLSRFEFEGKNTKTSPHEGGLRNHNQFRRPFNPQIMRRERRIEEYPIQTLVKTNNDNNLIEDKMNEEYFDFQEKIHLLQDGNDAIHLTQNDYENSINPRTHILKSELSQEDF